MPKMVQEASNSWKSIVLESELFANVHAASKHEGGEGFEDFVLLIVNHVLHPNGAIIPVTPAHTDDNYVERARICDWLNRLKL